MQFKGISWLYQFCSLNESYFHYRAALREKLGSVFHSLEEKLTQTKYNKLLGKGCLCLDRAQNLAISIKEQTDNFTVNTAEALPIKLITTL